MYFTIPPKTSQNNTKLSNNCINKKHASQTTLTRPSHAPHKAPACFYTDKNFR